MIRNVVTGLVRPDLDADGERDLQQGLAGIAALRAPGLLAMTVGRDLGLREGGWTFAIVNDWVDEDAYRAYDVEAEHVRYRSMVAAACGQIARVQFGVGAQPPDATREP